MVVPTQVFAPKKVSVVSNMLSSEVLQMLVMGEHLSNHL